jgi:GDPmannose 4,6-dehydratase
MKKVLITGITGQDGSFLAELLLSKDYQVFGFARQESWARPHNASHLIGKIDILFGDVSDAEKIASTIQAIMPDEIYNLASQSRPSESWISISDTLFINSMAPVKLFEVVKNICPTTRVYHASSSEMFGNSNCLVKNENSPFNPCNPYAASKLYAHNMARIYRESYGLLRKR